MNTAQNWEAKPLGPMAQLSGLPWNLVLESPSPSNLSSMRIIWGTHPLQLYDPTPHHPLIPQPPLKAGSGRSSLPRGPGPSVQDLKPAWSLNAPMFLCTPCAFSWSQGLMKPGHLGCLHSATLLVKCPGCGIHHSCPWWCGLSLRGVLILGDTWQVKQKGGSRQVLALSKMAAASPQEDPAGPGATLGSSW